MNFPTFFSLKKLYTLLFFVGLLLSRSSLAKETKFSKVKWKEVKIAESEPKDCTFVEKLDIDSGTWMTFSGKGFKEKSERKIKKAAGKIGSNVVFITKETMIGTIMNREANAYRCL